MNKFKKLLIGAAMVVVPFSSVALNASAQVDLTDSLTKVNSSGAFGDGGPDQLTNTIGSLIQTFLGILGIVFLVLVIYAGFTWMTAMGDEKKTTQAKNILISATVGLVVLLSAYAISSFVIDSLSKATG